MNIIQKSVLLADPHICSDAKNRLTIFNALFDCLVRRDSQGDFVPALATDWHIDNEARSWLFTLRDDVTFHSGSRMTSIDVVASLRRACDPSVGGELGTEGVWASYLGDAEIWPVDETTVSIIVGRPMADLLDLLVAIPIMPENVLDEVPDRFVGSGPWRLIDHDETHLVLERFEQAWTTHNSAVNGNRVTLMGEPVEERRVEALMAGRADLAADISPQSARQARHNNQAVLAQPANLCVAFLCNASRGVCSDKAFRQALNHAVNAERMIEQTFGGVVNAAKRLNGPLTPFHFGYDSALAPYAYDPAKAEELLAQTSSGQKLVVDVPMTLPDEAPQLGELLAEDLSAVGVDVTLRHFEDRPGYAYMVKEKRIDDACCFDSSPLSTYRVLREKFNSDVAGPWWQGYHNSTVNRLLEEASRTIDNGARRAIYRQAYRLLHEDAPWIFLYHPTNFWVMGEGVSARANSEGVLISL